MPKLSLHVPGSDDAYRNQPVVAALFGFAEPFSVTEKPEKVGANDVTAGGSGAVKFISEPNAVPAEFCAMAQ
jgi:hypothetical protein